MHPIVEITNDAEKIVKLTASSPLRKDAEYTKISLRPIVTKSGEMYQAERFRNDQVFHKNIAKEELSDYLLSLFDTYRQVCVFYAGATDTYFVGAKGKIKKSTAKNNLKKSIEGNDRAKTYLLNEGDDIPVMVDLGIFTPDYRIIKSKYDKFRQINKFIEIIDHELKDYEGKDITVLDFGCGKSYLTFVLRHYLVNVKKLNAKIIGYDLKKEVVADCNGLAKKYGYDDITFVVADVKKDVLYDEKIDMIVSLHACDTATDFAINYAITKGVKYLFSVPCCQHEVNLSIEKGGELDVLLRYGIVKERVSALLTDSIRAMILEDMGYKVDVLEFVDLAHSPKNLMIRGVKRKKPSTKNYPTVKYLQEKYGFKQTLAELVYKE